MQCSYLSKLYMLLNCMSMSKILRTPSLDLNVLRSILTCEEDNVISSQIGNKLSDSSCAINIEEDNNYKNKFITSDLEIKPSELVNQKSAKNKCDNSERRPFLLTRINTLNKLTSNKAEKSIEKCGVSPDVNKSLYKSIHYTNIAQKEEYLQRKYHDLAQLLEKDIISKTAAICDQSMNEARQLIQNSLAASRIVSSFVTECKDIKDRNFVSTSLHDLRSSPNSFSPIVILNDCHFMPKETITELPEDSIRTNDNLNYTPDSLLRNDSFHPPVRNAFTAVYGYGVCNNDAFGKIKDEPKKTKTDHRLSSDSPFIQNWLQCKEKEIREERRLERRTKKIERAVTMNAERVLERRKAASKEAFGAWCEKKSRDRRMEPLPDGEGLLRSADSSSDESLPQAGRQPRYVHNYVYRRPQSLARLKTADTFGVRFDLKMKLRGTRVDLLTPASSRPSAMLQPNLLATINTNKLRPQTAIPRSRLQVLDKAPKCDPPRPPIQRSGRKKKCSSTRRAQKVVPDESDDCENKKPDLEESVDDRVGYDSGLEWVLDEEEVLGEKEIKRRQVINGEGRRSRVEVLNGEEEEEVNGESCRREEVRRRVVMDGGGSRGGEEVLNGAEVEGVHGESCGRDEISEDPNLDGSDWSECCASSIAEYER